MLLVEAAVLVFGQLDHARSECRIDGVVGGSAAVAVGQAGRSLIGVGLVQALELPLGDAQELGRLSVD